jgi:hypothetical protein
MKTTGEVSRVSIHDAAPMNEGLIDAEALVATKLNYLRDQPNTTISELLIKLKETDSERVLLGCSGVDYELWPLNLAPYQPKPSEPIPFFVASAVAVHAVVPLIKAGGIIAIEGTSFASGGHSLADIDIVRRGFLVIKNAVTFKPEGTHSRDEDEAAVKKLYGEWIHLVRDNGLTDAPEIVMGGHGVIKYLPDVKVSERIAKLAIAKADGETTTIFDLSTKVKSLN